MRLNSFEPFSLQPLCSSSQAPLVSSSADKQCRGPEDSLYCHIWHVGSLQHIRSDKQQKRLNHVSAYSQNIFLCKDSKCNKYPFSDPSLVGLWTKVQSFQDNLVSSNQVIDIQQTRRNPHDDFIRELMLCWLWQSSDPNH